MAGNDYSEVIPFDARKAMQDAIWGDCIAPHDNEWTTWSDSIVLTETAAAALVKAGFRVVAINDTRAHAFERAKGLEAEIRRLKAERWEQELVAYDHQVHGPHTVLSHADQRYAGCRAMECEPLYRKAQG